MNLDDYFSRPGAESLAAFSVARGLNPDQVRQWRTQHQGRRPSPDKCVFLEQSTHGLLRRQDLRPDDWHLIWPELIPATEARTEG